MARGTKDINHAQFADDTILLGGASPIIACRFKLELNRYFQASGSKLNLSKSQIYGWNINPREMVSISRALNMVGIVSWDSFTYLGVPIFKLKTTCSAWSPIVDKIKKKITGWGPIWLNLARKVVLIKAILNSFPLYQCSLFLAPIKVINQIESLVRSFLWHGGNNDGGKKFALVSWKIIKLSRQEGRLEIRDLRIQNQAMGAKLLWNVIASKPSWCSRVIKNKYFPGMRLRCLEGDNVKKKGTSIFNLCKKSLPQFIEKLFWIPGNGKMINLWQDVIQGKPPPYLPRLHN